MDTWIIVTMSCVGIGFLLFGTAFYGFMKQWPAARIWALCIGAFLMATVVPVIIAVSHAATGG